MYKLKSIIMSTFPYRQVNIMAYHELESSPSKIRLWRYLPTLVIVGVAVYLLVPQIATLQNS